MAPDKFDKKSLNDMMPFVDEGTVIPIISNSFRLEEIFRDDDEVVKQLYDVPEYYDEVRTIERQLTLEWSKQIGYPMSEGYNLARVAQFRQVDSGDPEQPKVEYIKFLNDRLLKMRQKIDVYQDKVKELKPQTQRLSFAEVAQRLDFPDFEEGIEDPLLLLASLPLPIYVTTSFSTFLESALGAKGKTPRTQVCFYRGNLKNPSYLPDRGYTPTVTEPAVYHLFGLESDKQTMVLSEDDHMNFLMNAVEEINSQNVFEVFPSPLRSALSKSRLILLGYNLRDWDFRTLFRLISKIRTTPKVSKSIAIQFKPSLKPNLEKSDYEEKAREYLEQYFDSYKFSIIWAQTEKFIHELWDSWQNYGQSN